jgi:replicative DNA helicase
VIVDYLQDLQPGLDQRRRDEREQLSTIARSLQRLARCHAVPLVTISSVARDKYDSDRPTIAAFKGSGDIEYTLDAGLFLGLAADGPEDYERLRLGDEDEPPLELHLVKNRFDCAVGSEPLELRLHADTGVLLDADGGLGLRCRPGGRVESRAPARRVG